MEQAAAKSSANVLHKIESIEKEIRGLKLFLLKQITPTGKKIISLKGVLKGVEITDEDIASAKRSLYSKTGI